MNQSNKGEVVPSHSNTIRGRSVKTTFPFLRLQIR